MEILKKGITKCCTSLQIKPSKGWETLSVAEGPYTLQGVSSLKCFFHYGPLLFLHKYKRQPKAGRNYSAELDLCTHYKLVTKHLLFTSLENNWKFKAQDHLPVSWCL
ncbi:hypothetical protein AV530_012481 [Patagioenas fasciata monilis]|uniref:Uncharacterized protein n=1 Tax=Patagioenas fasciata monilis TaxID=372326 RepID=A0A1V4JBL7_PATFA|nr:hypothetical protein AV530_012481 [Patagioenas fasciata monilis]